jgi:AcrR family transcriptional regulator
MLRVGNLERLSLREVSRAVGVTPTACYRHFRDKEALLDAIAAEGFAELRDEMRKAARQGHVALPAIAETYRQFIDRERALAQLMFRTRPRGRGTRAALHDAWAECLAEFVAAVSAERTEIGPEEAIRLAVQAWASVHGLAMLSEAGAFGALDRWMLPTAADVVMLKQKGAASPS